MADRCSLTITLRKRDLPRLERILEEDFENEVHENTPGVVTVHFEEADYGLFEKREQLAEKGLVFYGSHSEGANYSPTLFAACKGTMIDVPRCWNALKPIAAVEEDGTVNEGDLRAARIYYKKMELIKQQFERTPSADTPQTKPETEPAPDRPQMTCPGCHTPLTEEGSSGIIDADHRWESETTRYRCEGGHVLFLVKAERIDEALTEESS